MLIKDVWKIKGAPPQDQRNPTIRIMIWFVEQADKNKKKKRRVDDWRQSFAASMIVILSIILFTVSIFKRDIYIVVQYIQGSVK